MVEQSIHFNDDDVYEQTMGIWSRLAGEPFLDWLAPRSGLRWIDIGCGTGAFTDLLIQKCAPVEVQGIDPSEAQLVFARGRSAARGAIFSQGDALALPFPSNRFDVAAMALVIFFLSDPEKGVSEMARVVGPGGMVATYAWDMLGGGFPWEPIHAGMRKLGLEPLLPPTVGASQSDTLRGLWTTAGFEATELNEITVSRTFSSFDEFWRITTQAASLQPTLKGMAPDAVAQLKSEVRSSLSADSAGRITYSARANAVRGNVPL